jgi:ribosomal protein S14
MCASGTFFCFYIPSVYRLQLRNLHVSDISVQNTRWQNEYVTTGIKHVYARYFQFLGNIKFYMCRNRIRNFALKITEVT